ncbi:Ktr system potassium uptake protein B [Paenibacillus sp. GM2FR]|uniref:Trk system potassium uptake protein TrkH n=1 Tax=Paenibacillus lactis TaxID=228574 RepID=A0ABS4FIC3_9BACL|nr:MULTISPECIES: TrkH family potassium uptake protein [Paenibacillus]MBP1895938.1 trk system potassium uptake protein TrkH [Paenibacillus lactis]MEC0258660.1 TrkH family potassium uptake protein [Paenibacillus lautus]PJN54865.1 Ktr system potassium uptake protein B [Paenibacillus sp. GM2FR]
MIENDDHTRRRSALYKIDSFVNKLKNNMSPPQLIMVVFFVLIWTGTLLLTLPLSSTNGKSVGLLNALFTATSAICVNGLVVVDTGSVYSTFGQVIIMILIQIGGLGFMTFGVMVAIVLGKRIGLKQRLVIQQTTHSTSAQGLVKLSLYMVLIAFAFEALATVILTIRWHYEWGWGQAAYYALFHSVSAFNNAGFALWSDSLSPFVGDPIVNITIVMLFIIGGLGYIVVVDLFRKRSWKRLSLHSKVVLLGTGILSGIGFLTILLLESWNPSTFGQLSGGERVLAAFFQGTTPRSSGFNTIDISSMLAASQFLMIILMFIGAASGGTGGGIKINTLIVLILATIQTFRGGGQIHAFKRKIGEETVMRALAVVMSSLVVVLCVSLLLTITEGMLEEHFLEVLFEATSAFSTTGLSMGLTSELSPPGKVIVIVTMFAGRLGPLTLAFALAQKKRLSKIGYAEDHILIG